MPIEVVCGCGKRTMVPGEHAGKRGKCPSCGSVVAIPAPAREAETVDLPPRPAAPASDGKDWAGELAVAAFDPFEGVKPAAAPPRPRRYKVLTQKDKWFSGKFDPERLEQAMNAYADQGWVVKAAVTASIPGFGGNRDELIVIMER